jgi:hypothetical protein
VQEERQSALEQRQGAFRTGGLLSFDRKLFPACLNEMVVLAHAVTYGPHGCNLSMVVMTSAASDMMCKARRLGTDQVLVMESVSNNHITATMAMQIPVLVQVAGYMLLL